MGNETIFMVMCLCITVLSMLSQASAAAWTQRKGAGQAILSLGAYQSSYYFDNKNHIQSSNSTFTKYEFNPFFEYGLTDDMTIGANPLFQHWQNDRANTYPDSNSRQCYTDSTTSGEIIESEFMLRKKLLESGNAVLSIQPLFKTPCISVNGNSISTPWNSYETELRLLGGYGFKWDPQGKKRPFAGQHHFIGLEAAYRKRNGEYSDQVKIDGTAGFRPNDNFLILGQFFSVISTREEFVGYTENTEGSFIQDIDDSCNLKLQLSGIMQVTKTASVQLGIYSDVWGKNYSQGGGVLASLWQGF